MQATSLIFPLPKKIQWRAAESTPFVRPKSWRLAGKAIPAWLKKHVGQNAGLQFDSNAAAKIHLQLSHTGFENISDIAIRDQAYTLEIFADGSVEIVSPSQTGLWHGLITLSHLLRAHAAGAKLGALLIHDQPAFRLRGVQLDLAREFFRRSTISSASLIDSSISKSTRFGFILKIDFVCPAWKIFHPLVA